MVSLVLGIVAFVCMAVGYLVQSVNLSILIWAGAALGLAAWIVGAKAVKRNKKDTAARVGKILGIIATIIGILLIVFVVLLTGAILGVASGM